MASSTKTRRQSGESGKQGSGRRKTQATARASGAQATRRRNSSNGASDSYMRSAERLAGQMKSALAEWTAMAGDSLPDAAAIARGRRNVRTFVEDNAVVLGIAGAGLGVLVGAAIAGGLREPRPFFTSDDERWSGESADTDDTDEFM